MQSQLDRVNKQLLFKDQEVFHHLFFSGEYLLVTWICKTNPLRIQNFQWDILKER